MAEPVAVRVRSCACPDGDHKEPVKYAGSETPIEGDVVFLAPKLSLLGGLQAQADIIEAAGNGGMLAARWQVTFVQHGATGWNFLDEDGPVPFDVNVLLEDYELASPVAEKTDELYGESVMRPLLLRLKMTSPSGRKSGSTSAIPQPTSRRRGPSSRPATAATPLSTP